MKPCVLLIVFVLIYATDSIAQEYYKIKISSTKVKFIKADKSKDVFVIDSIQAQPTGKIFYLSGAERKITMEFLRKKQLVRLRDVNKEGFYEPINTISLNTIAINDEWLE